MLESVTTPAYLASSISTFSVNFSVIMKSVFTEEVQILILYLCFDCKECFLLFRNEYFLFFTQNASEVFTLINLFLTVILNNMYQQYEWAEEDFVLPCGVVRLDLPQPNSHKTYVMYHGTTRKAAQSILATGFRQSSGGMLGRGVYLSRDLEKASRYPINHPEHDRVVIRVKVSVGKVIAINRQGHPLQKTWHDSGYDTAWVPPNCGMVTSGLEENCVWDPNRIQIMATIKPRPVQYGRCGAHGYM